MTEKPIAAGKSSYDLIDAALFWKALDLEKQDVLLDLGCGIGNYALEAAARVGPQGLVYAVDAWAEGIQRLEQRMAERGLTNIITAVADISRSVPVPPGLARVCLLATVVHDLIQDQRFEGTMNAISDVMPAKGRLAVVEFKKMAGPPGPPIQVRLSPEELDRAMQPFGFNRERLDDVSPSHYLAQYQRRGL